MTKLSPLGMARFRKLAKDRAEVDLSTSRALPCRPKIYRLRVENEHTRLLTLEDALALAGSIVILPRTVECEAKDTSQ